MTKISSFKAIRPIKDKAHLITSRSYYTYKKDELESILENNPFSFLHIISSNFELPGTSHHYPKRFSLVKKTYNDFLEKGIFIQDETPKIYLYRQTKNDHEYTGIIAGASIQEYLDQKIKIHEATITQREEMFTNYLESVGYNAEPVMLTYSDDNNSIDSHFDSILKQVPEYKFSTSEKIEHELWVLTTEQSISIQEAFAQLNHVYIADGHHRTASSVGLFNRRSKNGYISNTNDESFLSFFINESRIHILEYNRIIKNLNGHSKKTLLIELEKSFILKELRKSQKPSQRHEITMYIDDTWYSLKCKADIIDKSHPVKSLDSQILTDYVLSPILDIKDLKNNKDIEFLSGNKSLINFESEIKKKNFKIGFILHPVNIEEIKKVADNEMIMPPKSTWIEPKLRSGLTIYNLNE